GIRDLYVTGVQTCALPIYGPQHGGVNRGREPDACLSKPPECLGSRKLERSDVDLHEVRLHLLEIDPQPGLDETLCEPSRPQVVVDRKSTRLNSSHVEISYA